MWDMAGNVAEWIQTPGEVRGGSYVSDPFGLRITASLDIDPSDRRSDVGVRCAYSTERP